MQELGASFEESDEIPAAIADLVEEYREKLVEAAVELDDDVMEAYLEVLWLALKLCMPCAALRFPKRQPHRLWHGSCNPAGCMEERSQMDDDVGCAGHKMP